MLVKADIPGLKKEEIDVSLNKNQLTLKGEKKREEEFHEKNYYRSESHYGNFIRTISLPSEVDCENVKATYNNGVLELKLAKKEETNTKRISVDVQ